MKLYWKLFAIGALQVAFIAVIFLKVCGLEPFASWSWGAMLSPFWIPAWALVGFFFYVLLYWAFAALFGVLKNRANAHKVDDSQR